MKLREALNFKEKYFHTWYGKKFAKNKAEIYDIWVIPKEEHFHKFYFNLLDSDEAIETWSAKGVTRDLFALTKHGNWYDNDEFTIMFDLRYEDENRTDFRRLAKEFLLDEEYEEKSLLENL